MNNKNRLSSYISLFTRQAPFLSSALVLSMIVSITMPLYKTAQADGHESEIAQARTSASLGDFVWLDQNGNGVQDAGEVGLEYVTVSLLNAESNVLNSTKTDVNGYYRFNNLEPGAYAIRVELPKAEYHFSPQDMLDNTQDSDTVDSDVDPATGISPFAMLESGESDHSWDAGIVAPPNLIVAQEATTGAVQRGDIALYSISYANVGIGDASGVQLTEIVPRHTTFVAESSSKAWVCAGGAVKAGTVCTMEIGSLPTDTQSAEDVLFAVRINAELPADIQSIDAQVLISDNRIIDNRVRDDRIVGASASAQQVDNATIIIQHSTSLDTASEPRMAVVRSQFRSKSATALEKTFADVELTPDQIVMFWLCSFMDNFGWTSDACFMSVDSIEVGS